MKRTIAIAFLVVGLGLGGFVFRGSLIEVGAKIKTYFGNEDPDLPSKFANGMSKKDFMQARAAQIAQMRGWEPDNPFDSLARGRAIELMEKQEQFLQQRFASSHANLGAPGSPLAAWTPIGPSPIPNGQTQTTQTAVSGRVTAIDVHPTNPLIAFVGTAQGGVFRTLDGGATWTPLMDSAQSLAIGAITIDPLNPDIVFIGTGEGNLSLDSFFGVGLYRIDNATTGSPTLSGPFETQVAGTGSAASNGHAFAGTSINKIVVDPANDSRIFVGNTLGGGGPNAVNYCCGNASPPSGLIGLYFSANATAATPVFSRVAAGFFNGLQGVTDIVFEPGSSNNMLIGVEDFGGLSANGVYRTTNAATASQSPSTAPTFTKVINNGANQYNSKLAINKVGATVTVYAASEQASGTLRKSTDGGATFPTTLAAATGFCDGQCWYDMVVAVDPTNANNVYISGNVRNSPAHLAARSTDGGTSFQNIDNGLHADSHALVLAPSNLAIAYHGNDGGVWRSNNINDATPANVTWTSLNNSTLSATQFESIAVHPSDPNFTIGGTQDNGTNFYQPNATWTRADFGDGGFALIDQNAANTTNVTMYHTYFNQTNNLIGFARTSATTCASDANWAFKGFGAGVFTNGCGDVEANNGITGTDAVLFYAPMALGPGNPNTLYFGTDRLYRSTDRGNTMLIASQAPITSGVPISAIGISRQNDNVRIVGQQNGGIWGTTAGSLTLTNLDTGNAVPNSYIARAVIDPTNPDIAYVTLSTFTSAPVWKTSNLSSATPTWTSMSSGLPQVPVDAFVVDPLSHLTLYAGTDIGVYSSTDGGTTWSPFGTGLPRVAVFDMAITSGTSRLLRIATHGRGMWQTSIATPTAAGVTISGRVLSSSGMGIRGALVSLTDMHGIQRRVLTNAFGYYSFESVQSGQSFVMRASARQATFSTRILSVTDTLTGVDFIEGQ